MHDLTFAVAILALGAATWLPDVTAQAHDPLARARQRAAADNQRLLLHVRGGDPEVAASLADALTDPNAAGRLVRDEYRTVTLPEDSALGRELRARLSLDEVPMPLLAVLDPRTEHLLGVLDATSANGTFDVASVVTFLERHVAARRVAREVLAAGLERAKDSQRHAFVYLSAPW